MECRPSTRRRGDGKWECSSPLSETTVGDTEVGALMAWYKGFNYDLGDAIEQSRQQGECDEQK